MAVVAWAELILAGVPEAANTQPLVQAAKEHSDDGPEHNSESAHSDDAPGCNNNISYDAYDVFYTVEPKWKVIILPRSGIKEIRISFS